MEEETERERSELVSSYQTPSLRPLRAQGATRRPRFTLMHKNTSLVLRNDLFSAINTLIDGIGLEEMLFSFAAHPSSHYLYPALHKRIDDYSMFLCKDQKTKETNKQNI